MPWYEDFFDEDYMRFHLRGDPCHPEAKPRTPSRLDSRDRCFAWLRMTPALHQVAIGHRFTERARPDPS